MRDDSCYMEPLQLAGRIIMENGGETYRVEETITRMGRAFGFAEVEAFAIPSGIFISYRKSDGTVETAVKRVRKGATNLTRVDAVNAISRRVEKEGLTCGEVLSQLRAVEEDRPLLSPAQLVGAVAVSSAGWAVMFGGGWVDFFVAAAGAALAQLRALAAERYRMRSMVSVITGSFLSTILPMLFHLATGLISVDATVAACLMPMLPGLAMTNAVQDAIRGDMVSAISSGTSAVLTAAMIAGGALIGSALFRLMTGGVPV